MLTKNNEDLPSYKYIYVYIYIFSTEEGTGQYTVYSQTIPQRGPCRWYFVITIEK